MKSINHFDLIAPYYDRFIKPADVTRFIAIINLPTTGYLLDAGGGTGRKSLPLKEMTSGIVIADSSLGMLSQAQAKGSSLNICSETEQLPFKAESYERIIMVDTLHHVANFRHTLQELWRILKPGGRLVIEEPDIRTLPVRVLAMLEKLALMRSHFISPQIISEELSNRGAKVVTQIDHAIAWIIADKLVP